MAYTLEYLVTAPFEPDRNLTLQLRALADSWGNNPRFGTLELRKRPSPFADLRIFLQGPPEKSDSGPGWINALERHPSVAKLIHGKGSVAVRLSDEFVLRAGRLLQRGAHKNLYSSAVLKGKSFVVGFGGPNTSKALHVGHLRNLTLGNALASALSFGGAPVVRQSLLGDFGRSVCEAMAGFSRFHMDQDPASLDLKPDHFVNRCYDRYLETLSPNGEAREEPANPIPREERLHGDMADQLLRRWLKGEPYVRMLWQRIRGWVLEGHRATLERFDAMANRYDCESTYIDGIAGLIDRGLSIGVFLRTSDQQIVYRSGREDFPTMIMVRSDGFPTEHLRLLAVYGNLLQARPQSETYLDLAGVEWQPASALHMELLAALWPDHRLESHLQLFHGMVQFGRKKASSSLGGVPLLDDVLDRVQNHPEVLALADKTGGAVGAGEVANLIVKGFFLFHPHQKPLTFSMERLLARRHNPGWVVAATWCAVAGRRPLVDSPASPSTGYRLAVLAPHGFAVVLAKSLETFELTYTTRFLLHYCSHLFPLLKSEPALRPMVFSTLRPMLLSLGMIPAAGETVHEVCP